MTIVAKGDGGFDDGAEGREERFVSCFVNYGGRA